MTPHQDRDILAHALRMDVPVKDGRLDVPAMIMILASRLDEVQRQAFLEKMAQLDQAEVTRSKTAPAKRPSHPGSTVLN